MDCDKSSRTLATFRKAFRAAGLTLGVVFGPFVFVLCGGLLLQKFIELRTVRGVIGVCVGACAVWLVVRRINRRDDPQHAKRSPNARGLLRFQMLASSEKFWIDFTGLIAFLAQLAILAAAIYVCYVVFDFCSAMAGNRIMRDLI